MLKFERVGFKMWGFLCNESCMLLFELTSFLPVMFFLFPLKFGLKLGPSYLDINPGLPFVQNDIYLQGRI